MGTELESPVGTAKSAASDAEEHPVSFERRMDARLALSFIAVGLAAAAGIVAETAMNVALPTLCAEFGTSTGAVQWVTTAYLLTIACVISTFSYLQRRFTARTLFSAILISFALGIVLAAAAPTFEVLLVARVIQGVAGGIALPLLFNIVLTQVPFERMGFLMGFATLIASVAPGVGPFVGGVVLSALGWRAIFLVLLPVLALSAVCGLPTMRQATPIERAPFNILDFVILVICYVCLIFGVTGASANGWGSVQVILPVAAALAAAVLFFWRSRRAKNPLIRVEVLACAPFALSLMVILLVQFTTLSLGYLIPNYAQISLGATASLAGCLLLPGCAVGSAFSPISGRIADRIGFFRPILLGNAFILVSMLLMAVIGVQLPVLGVAALYALYALGQGFTMGNSMTNGLNALPRELSADGNAVINTLQQLAGAVGTAVTSSIVAGAQAANAADEALGTMCGAQQAFMLFALLAVAVACCTVAANACRGRVKAHAAK